MEPGTRSVKIAPAEPASEPKSSRAMDPELKRFLTQEPFRLRSYDSGAIEAPGANNLNGSGPSSASYFKVKKFSTVSSGDSSGASSADRE